MKQAERLEETGAGIQLSPNATRTLIDLGLGDRLRPHVVAPQAVRVLSAKNGREIVRIPLGEAAAQRYGAPYWIIHRGDLQAALAARSRRSSIFRSSSACAWKILSRIANGVTVSARGTRRLWDERGDALIAADGLWSMSRARASGSRKRRVLPAAPHGARLVPAKEVAPEFREPLIHLWLGRDAHLVHYPVKGGRLINIVVITDG